MTNTEITKQFLLLLSRYWGDFSTHQGFRDLLPAASGQYPWLTIIQASLLALEKKTAKSIELLNSVLTAEPNQACARLLFGIILSQDAKQWEEACNQFDLLLKEGFHDQVQPDWFHSITFACKACALGRARRCEEVLQTADKITSCFKDSTEPVVQSQVAKAMVTKGYAHRQMKQPDKEIKVCDEVIRRFGKSTEPSILAEVARAMVNKGCAHRLMNRPDEEIKVCDEVIRRFGKSTEPSILAEVARAMANKGYAHRLMNRPDEEIKVCDKVIRRFG
jgi:hypothetical protein